MFLFMGSVLVDRSVLSDHALRLIQKRGFLLSFNLGGSSRYKDIFLNISLLVLEIFTEGPTLESPMPLAVMKGEIVFSSKKSRIVLFQLWTLHSEVILDASKMSWIGSFSGLKLLSTQ